MSDLNSRWLKVLPAIVVAMSASAVAQSHSATRASGFEYDAKGMLSAELIEPASPDHCVRTSYELDAYGNRTRELRAGCPGASASAQFATRSTVVAYAAHSVVVNGLAMQVPAGSFATSTTNALGHTESRQFDPRFGTMISSTGPNGLTTSWQYDDLGRKILEIGADGNRTITRYCLLAGQGDASANSAGCLSAPMHRPTHAVSYAESQPQDSTGTPIGPYSRKYFDALGREIRHETQGFDGAGQPANARIIAKDTEYNAYGAIAKVTQPFFVDSGVGTSVAESLAAGGWTATSYDALGRPLALSVRNDEGSQSTLGQTVAVRTFSYDGPKLTESSWRTSKNGEGQQQPADELRIVQMSDPLGRVIEVTDAIGSTLRKRYDAFDNIVETQDPKDNRVRAAFDIRGRRTGLFDPNSGTWGYRYNALGELVGQQNPNQRVSDHWTTIEYDLLGRIRSRSEPGDYVSTWNYDSCSQGIGKVCQVVTDHGYTRSYQYDPLGRPIADSQTVAGRTDVFTGTTTYDSLGRPGTYTYPTGLTLTHVYTPLGYPSEVRLNSESIWRMGSASAWGTPQSFELGAGSSQNTHISYDAVTGRTTKILAGTEGSILEQAYGWDTVGNLTDRSDRYGGASGVLSENFGYDELNRLYRYETSSPDLPGLSKTVVLTYDAIGNILEKSDVGTYGYPESGASSVRPSAVTSITGTQVGNRSYDYDEAGNLIGSTGSQFNALIYTSFNLPRALSGASASYAWAYGEGHQRIRETKVSAAGSRTTWYFHPDNAGGLAFEQESSNGGASINRHYVRAMGRTLAVVETAGDVGTMSASVPAHWQYWHVDQLGSVAAIATPDGTVERRYSYDPFGKRREPSGAYDGSGTLVSEQVGSQSTDRGFTGHEHLDDVGVVHMNGRTFDPLLGRFMQPDPYVQFDANAQSHNRYSYVLNNPLNSTDPTGQFVQFIPVLFSVVGYEMATAIIANSLLCTAFSVTWGPIVAATVGAAMGGAIAGAAPTDLGRSILSAGLSAGMFNAVGTAGGFHGYSPSPVDNFGDWLVKTTSHSAVGCISGKMNSDDCRSGAIGAGASAALGFARDSLPGEHTVQLGSTVLIGGAAAQVAGGKFANGATTAAMGYLFNTIAQDFRNKYSRGKGHHDVPFGEWPADLSDEAARVFGRATTGEIEPGRHKFDENHKTYGKAVREALDRTGIKPSLMTADQAEAFVAEIRASSDPRIKGYRDHLLKHRVPSRIGVKGFGFLGAILGLHPLVTDKNYSWKNYLEDSTCGLIGGCAGVE